MTKTMYGKVRGKTIEFEEDLGVADGQEVEVEIKLTFPERKWGDGVLRTAGALAEDPHWDAIMEQVHRGRKAPRRP